jgi:hypothetical protein
MLEALCDIYDKDSRESIPPPELFAAMRQRFPDCTVGELLRVLEIRVDAGQQKLEEAIAERKCTQQQRDEWEHIYDGLDRYMHFGKAIAIKAAQDDPVALWWQAQLNSKAARMVLAMFRAAAKMHPQWRITEGVYRWLGKGEPMNELELILWFQIIHPTEARKIEAEFDAEGS